MRTPPDFSMWRMPATLHGCARKEQTISAGRDPKRDLDIQLGILDDENATNNARTLPFPNSRAHDPILA